MLQRVGVKTAQGSQSEIMKRSNTTLHLLYTNNLLACCIPLIWVRWTCTLDIPSEAITDLCKTVVYSFRSHLQWDYNVSPLQGVHWAKVRTDPQTPGVFNWESSEAAGVGAAASSCWEEGAICDAASPKVSPETVEVTGRRIIDLPNVTRCTSQNNLITESHLHWEYPRGHWNSFHISLIRDWKFRAQVCLEKFY